MSTGNVEAPPAFVGKINVQSTNNELYWTEETGAINLNATLNIAEYYPDALCSAIKSAMDTASSTSGNALTYTVTFDVSTGKYTISATGNFRLRINDMSLAGQLLTGGNEDSEGNTLTTGFYGPMYLGFPVTSAVGSYSDSFTSPNESGVYWSPSRPVARNPGPQYLSTATSADAIGGQNQSYDYIAAEFDITATDFPYPSNLPHELPLFFRLLSQEDRKQYIALFWAPYAKSGSPFRFYEENDSADYAEYKLSLENMLQSGFPARRAGYPYYETSIVLRSFHA